MDVRAELKRLGGRALGAKGGRFLSDEFGLS